MHGWRLSRTKSVLIRQRTRWRNSLSMSIVLFRLWSKTTSLRIIHIAYKSSELSTVAIRMCSVDQCTKLKKRACSIDNFTVERVIALNQSLIIHHNRFTIIHEWKRWDTYSTSIAHSGQRSLRIRWNLLRNPRIGITLWHIRQQTSRGPADSALVTYTYDAMYFRNVCVAYVALQ